MSEGPGGAAPASDVVLAHAVRTDVGRVRGNNEDSHGVFRLDDGSLLVVVCDGMGGHEAGEVASGIAVDVIEREVWGAEAGEAPEGVLRRALTQAHEAILAEGRQGGKRGMGTTAVVAWVRGRDAWIAHAGDSRLYLVRGGRVVRRSVDHSRVQSLVDKGVISQAEAHDHPDSGVLTRALGHPKMADGQPFAPEIAAEAVALAAGDALVLSSDGLHDLVSDDEIAATVAGCAPVVATERLVELALGRGGHDNVTVAVVTVGGTASPSDEDPPGLERTLPIPRDELVPAPRPVAAVLAALLGGLLLFASAFLVALALAQLSG